jgi:DMSO reductase family type II enzyme molybdopterin subunit
MTPPHRPSGNPSANGQRYRDRWTWDSVAWASHCINCYPGNCPERVYVKDGKVVREEVAAAFSTIQEGVPDMNPMGCQKGAGWSRMLDAEERVIYPLKRVGERGSGSWERISWDQACTEVADAVLDAVAEVGPESVIAPSGGSISTWGAAGRGRLLGIVGGLVTDVNGEVNDFAPGHYLTYGTFDPVSSVDDWFHTELFLIWYGNPVYTRIPYVHFINEARYNGAEVYTIAPDASPSTIHADYYVPVKPETDAALCLSLCQVVVEEGLVHEQFVREQTDLPLLVNPVTNRFLRQSDLEEGGSDEQFYAWDQAANHPVEAPRGTLFWDTTSPALEGDWTIDGKDGPIPVTTVFALMRRRLADYTPEKAAAITGVHPETIRQLARKVARKRTNIIGSLGNGKYYHGDLVERAEILLLALTGNWGKHGCGVRGWMSGFFDGPITVPAKSKRGPADVVAMIEGRERAAQLRMADDPTLTPAMIAIDGAKAASATGRGAMFPPVFFWYWHAGYKNAWRNAGWHDPSMKRPFEEYFDEAVAKGWWQGCDYPRPDQPPRVLIECGGNLIRRTRGGGRRLLEHLWPQLKTIVTLDVRMSATALYSDYVLPIAQQYEKVAFGTATTHVMHVTFCDKAVEPPGEAVDEWEAFGRIAAKLEERAKARGVEPYADSRGGQHDLANAYTAYTRGGLFNDTEMMADEMLRDSAVTGSLPPDASLAGIREKGFYRFQGAGISPKAIAQAADPKPDETFAPFTKHVEEGEPYPTLTRRAQFLIEHEWFVEADEHLPTYKPPPRAGGDYPFRVTSGHNRWSIHAINITDELMLATNRGTPHLVMNTQDARRLGIKDNDLVRVYNDQGQFRVPVLLSTGGAPGQVMMYNGFEPFQFPNWEGPNDAEPGMIKWLHLAGGYGHLKYWVTEWQPSAVMRGTRVAVEKVVD